MWAYLARYPGLVVLHDARLHHARARHLLSRRRVRRLPPRVLVRPPGRAARLRRVRGRRARRTDLLLLVDAARGDADGAAGRRPQRAGRRRPARRVSRTRAIEAIHLGHPAVRRSGPGGARARARGARRPGDVVLFARLRQGDGGEADRSDPARVRGARAASGPTSICCWPATRRTIPALADEIASPAIARRVHVTGYRRRRGRSATTSRRPMPACACAGRPRSKPRRRGCTAWRRRGRP